MKQIVYRIFYNSTVNFVFRNVSKFFLPFLPSKIKISPSGILKISNKSGKTLKIKTNQTNYLTKVIFWQGYRSFEYTDIFIKLIKKLSTFYDVGANIGYYSLIAAMENKNINVVGFEPASGPLFFFRENVRINNYDNIIIEPIALSHKEGDIDFYEIKNRKYKYLEHNLAGESNTGSNTKGRNFFKVKVKTTTLDNYVKSNNIVSIDLIKMDTEGTENLILEKSGFVLTEMKPIIICETLFNTIEVDLEKVMKLYGYEFFNHVENGLKKQKSIVRKENNGVSNCFFVHPSKYHLIEEFVVN